MYYRKSAASFTEAALLSCVKKATAPHRNVQGCRQREIEKVRRKQKLLFADTRYRKIENLAAKIVYGIQDRIAAGVKMLLFHAEDLHILLFPAQLNSQRVIMLWN